ncbi:MAG: phytanoyl-CoA dioxygenase family protein [Verrucomicrobia bacterium]|nr:phytanoyl-CoA dioxygenase family protein [Verrucomicrobiota bacterium]
MSTTATFPALTALGHAVDTDPAAFGELRTSDDIAHDVAALHARMAEDGYLFIRNLLPRDLVLEARRSLLERLAAAGGLHPDHPLMDGIAHPEKKIAFMPALANPNAEIERVIYGPELMGFYERFLGGAVRHFDYTWVRSVGLGHGSTPHCDMVYMGRGTHRLFTCWVPYGEIPLDESPLVILENSHRQSERLKAYLASDVDTYCENRPHEVKKVRDEGGWLHNGSLSNNPVSLREKLGGRWLTAQFRPGDFLTFPMNTVHASLDNATDRIRLSTDSRYQLASEPADERWVGANPPLHGPRAKRGFVC